MQYSSIRQMFYCKRGNYASIPMDDKYEQLLNKLVISDKKLSDALSNHSDLKILFKDYYEDLTNLNLHMEECVFIEAFRFGLLMGLEIKDND